MYRNLSSIYQKRNKQRMKLFLSPKRRYISIYISCANCTVYFGTVEVLYFLILYVPFSSCFFSPSKSFFWIFLNYSKILFSRLRFISFLCFFFFVFLISAFQNSLICIVGPACQFVSPPFFFSVPNLISPRIIFNGFIFPIMVCLLIFHSGTLSSPAL